MSLPKFTFTMYRVKGLYKPYMCRSTQNAFGLPSAARRLGGGRQPVALPVPIPLGPAVFEKANLLSLALLFSLLTSYTKYTRVSSIINFTILSNSLYYNHLYYLFYLYLDQYLMHHISCLTTVSHSRIGFFEYKRALLQKLVFSVSCKL